MEHKQDDDRASLRYSCSLEVLTEELSTSCQPFQLTGRAKAVSTLLYLNVNTIVTGVEGKAEPATTLGLLKALENNSVFHLFIPI